MRHRFAAMLFGIVLSKHPSSVDRTGAISMMMRPGCALMTTLEFTCVRAASAIDLVIRKSRPFPHAKICDGTFETAFARINPLFGHSLYKLFSSLLMYECGL